MTVLEVITSNGFPNDYSNGEEQRWVVCAFQNNPLCLRFTDFHTERDFDFVEIATDNGSFVGKYSGSFLPPTLRLSLNTLINFTSDVSLTGKGFRAEFCKQLLHLIVYRLTYHTCNTSGPSTCPVLTSPQKGHFSSFLNIVGTRVQLLCQPGYGVVGTGSVSCQASGIWSHTIGHCQSTIIWHVNLQYSLCIRISFRDFLFLSS